MLKNLKILAILGLLLSVGNSYTLSKTPKKYVTQIEARKYGVIFDKYYEVDSLNKEFRDQTLKKDFIITSQNFELQNKTKSKVMVIAELFNQNDGSCIFLGSETIGPKAASNKFKNIVIRDAFQIKIVYPDEKGNIEITRKNNGCAETDSPKAIFAINTKSDKKDIKTFYFTLKGDDLTTISLKPETGQLNGLSGITESGLYLGDNVEQSNIKRER